MIDGIDAYRRLVAIHPEIVREHGDYLNADVTDTFRIYWSTGAMFVAQWPIVMLAGVHLSGQYRLCHETKDLLAAAEHYFEHLHHHVFSADEFIAEVEMLLEIFAVCDVLIPFDATEFTNDATEYTPDG